jgi:hypothetical protein
MRLHSKKNWLAVGLLMACIGVFAAEERTAELRLDAEELYPMNIGDGKYDVLPVDGMPVDENPPFLFCSPEVPNRTGYEYVFRLSQDPEMKKNVIQGTPRRWTFYSPYQVLTKGVWYWQYGYRQVGEGAFKFSKTYSFRIADEARDNKVPPFRVLTEALDKSPLPRVICKADEVGKLWPQDAEFRAQVEKAMKDKAKIPIKLPEIAPVSKSKTPAGKKGAEEPRYEGVSVRSVSPYMAAYALTKDPVYIPEMKKAVDFILATRKFNPVAGFFDEIPNPVCFYYELLHDQMPAAERDNIRKVLSDALFGAINARINGLERYTLNEHDWQSDVPCMVYMAGVLYDKQVPASVEALEYLYDLWNFRGPVGDRNSGDWASFGYFQTHVKELFRVPFFFSRYTGYNYFDELPWYRNVGKRYAYFALPGSNETWGDGNSFIHELMEILNLYSPDRYRQLSWNSDENPIEARRVFEMTMNDWFALPALAKAPLPNRKNPAVPIQPLTEKGVLFRDTGLVVLCTKPEDPTNNVKVLMRSSPFGLIGHGHPGNNAFVISYNGKSAFEGTGTYSSSGDYFSLQNFKHTRAKNSILPCGNVCEGLDSSGYGWMPRFLVGDKISYCLGDASQAFSGKFTRHEGNLKKAGLTKTAKDGFIKPGVTRWRRHLALLENGTVIVYDELEAEKPITWTYMLNNRKPLDKLADDRILSGSDAVAVAQLFTTEALSTTVTDQWYGEDQAVLKKALGWKTGMRNQDFPKNQWHAYMAVTNPVAKLRFLNVIRPTSMKKPEPCKEQVAANGRKQVVVDGWTIEAELDGAKPSFLKIWNEAGTAALVSGQAAGELQLGETVERPKLSGTTVLMEKVAGETKPKVQTAVDILPDVVRYGNIY